MEKTLPQCPRHVSAKSRRWFKDVLATWELTDPHHIALLVACCESLDRAMQAREHIARDGPYMKNRFGEIRKHPALSVERDSLIVFSRLLRELDLDISPPVEARRPPALRSIRGYRSDAS